MDFFGLSRVTNGNESELKLFDIFFDITNISLLGESDDHMWKYYFNKNYDIRIHKDGTAEITIIDEDVQNLNFIGKELCSFITCKGRFNKDGLMTGEWLFELRNDKHTIISKIKGCYDNRGLKKGPWFVYFGSEINYFNLIDDLFHGDIVVHSRELRKTYTYDNGRKIKCIISLIY